MSQSEPHPVTEEFEKSLEESEREEELEEDLEDEREAASTKAITEAAADAQAAADTAIADAFVDDLKARARKNPQNPFEAISSPKPDPVLDGMVTRVVARLGKATAADISRAHTEFVEKVLGVDLSATAADKRGAAADKLLAALVLKVQGKAVPSSGDPKADQSLQSVVDSWKTVDDDAFWSAMSSAWEHTPLSAQEATDHLLFLRAVGDMTPPANPPRTYIWASKSAKSAAVEKIIAAGGAAPDSQTKQSGPIDVAAMYRTAGKMTSQGRPVPREVAIELVRLALAQVGNGTKPVRVTTPQPVYEPTRQQLKTRLKPEMVTIGSADEAEAKSRNAAREAALTLLTRIGKRRDYLGPKASAIFELTRSALTESFYNGRGDLGEVFTNAVTELSLAMAREPGVRKNLRQTLANIVEKSGFAEAASAWSKLTASADPDPKAVKDALDRLDAASQSILGAIDPSLDTDMLLLSQLQWIVGSASVEIAREAADMLPDLSLRAPYFPEEVPRVRGALTALELASTQGRARKQAIIARESEQGIGNYASNALSEFNTAKWAADLTSAASMWTAADQLDIATMLSETENLARALDSARNMLSSAPPDERYVGGQVIDALATAVTDRVDRLAQTSDQVSPTEAARLEVLLSSSLLPFAPPEKLSSYWSKGKDTISGELPKGLNLDLSTRIRAWEATMADTPINLDLVSTRTLSVAQAAGDYRVRIDSSPDLSSADKAILLGLLDTVLGTLHERVAPLLLQG